MAAQAQVVEIEIDPESEAGKKLAAAGDRKIVLVSGGHRFPVVSESAEGPDASEATRPEAVVPVESHDPERAAAAWRASFGVWRGMDLETLKAELREQRGQDSVGRPGR